MKASSLDRQGRSRPSVALARCAGAEGGVAPDQTAYEPLFRGASDVLANYRGLLDVKKIVPEELAKIGGESKPKTDTKVKGTMAKPAKGAPNK